jgi:rubrerythrin
MKENNEVLKLESLIQVIVASPGIHARWLNTLSMMENVGARKIAQAEHPLEVSEMMLKHAAEEARHAYYLKKQLKKISTKECPTYASGFLLAPVESYHYLHRLDVFVSRYLREVLKLDGYELRYAAYLLVTYAIEVRADELYPVYQKELHAQGSKVSVRTIIAEEKGHLEEMIAQLSDFFEQWQEHAEVLLEEEKKCYEGWLKGIAQALEQEQVLTLHPN